jgi:DNA-binding IclR family transcriptional regulator
VFSVSGTAHLSSAITCGAAGGSGGSVAGKTAAAKVLVVLEAFAAHGSEVGVAELARTARLPKTTTHRMLGFLRDAGFVDTTGGRYRLTAKVGRLTPSADDTGLSLLREHLVPHLTDLYEATRQPALLVVRTEDGARVAERVSGSRSAGFVTRLGATFPLHCTAAGKLLLAHSRDLGAPEPALERFTAATIVDRRRLERSLSAARLTGIAFDVNEWRPGVTSAAVLLKHFEGGVTAAVSVVGPSARMDIRMIEPHLRRIGHHAAVNWRGPLDAAVV